MKCGAQKHFTRVNEGTVFLMNVYLNVMAKLQKEKKTLRNRLSFQSSSQSLIIANASFKSNPSHDSKKTKNKKIKTDRSI